MLEFMVEDPPDPVADDDDPPVLVPPVFPETAPPIVPPVDVPLVLVPPVETDANLPQLSHNEPVKVRVGSTEETGIL